MKNTPLDYQGVVTTGLSMGLVPPIKGPISSPVEWRAWDLFLTPVDDQGRTGTCAAQAMTRIMEWAVVMHDGYRPRISPLKYYRAVWSDQNGKPWPEDGSGYQDGLQAYTAYTSGVKLGLLPPDAARVDAEPTPASLAAALTASPLFAATCVTEGWRLPSSLGEILDANVTVSGHAWTISGLGRGRDGAQMVCGVNSWGMRWGWNGFLQMKLAQFARCSWIKPFAISADWAKWVAKGTWKDLLVGPGELP
jgi:hypothetical protein